MITLENRFFPLRSAACFLIEGGIITLSVLSSSIILRAYGHTNITVDDVILRALLIALFCQMCMYMLDLYDLRQSHTWGELFFSLIFAVGVICIGIGFLSYIHPRFAVEGEMYYLTIVFVALLLLLWRTLFDYYLKNLAPRENILIVGTGQVAQMVGKEVLARDRLGFQLAGFVNESCDHAGTEVPRVGQIIGDYSMLPDIIRKFHVKKIVVAINERRGGTPVRQLLDIKVAGGKIVEWQSFFENLAGRIPIDNLPPSFFIFGEGFRKSVVNLHIRHAISTIIAALLFLLLFPVYLLIGILVKLDSPGPMLYFQERVGWNGKVFRIYKFRSMRKDAEGEGAPRWASKNDPRVTRVGRVIRILRLDEIPQLLNVLKGDIDLVGPRPERPEFVAELQKVIPYYTLRHTVKPGLTGWAQIMFPYGGSIEESKEKLQYDLFYIKNMSLKLDLLILFRTIKIVLLGRGAR